MDTPKRYRFDTEAGLPVHRPVPLPEQRPAGTLDHQQQPPQVVVQHFHQAPPDRTLQRAALGAGIGGGAVTAAVLLAPLVIAALHALVASLAVLALLVAVVAWAVVSVVNAVAGASAKRATPARRGLLRRR